MDRRFERLGHLIGNDKVDLLNDKYVTVLGVGGVGGYVVESLVRSGIGHITIIDYDTIDITNINRQIIATTSDIGKKKVEVFKNRILSINPECDVKIIDSFIDEENYKELFSNKVDYFIDACDSVKTKKSIIKYCLLNNINIISSMGAGNRMNIEDLEIIEIKKTSGDPLARIIRKFLKEERINKKLMVMCSKEIPKKVDGVISSNSFVPSAAGLLISSYVIKELIK